MGDALEPVELEEEIVSEFVLEASEQLGETDGNLLALEADSSDEEARAAVFRCFHTIKGLAGFLGFPQVEHLAHAAEDLLDQAQRLPIDAEAIDAVFAASDMLRELAEEINEALPSGVWTPVANPKIDELEARIHEIYERREAEAAGDVPSPVDEVVSEPSLEKGDQAVAEGESSEAELEDGDPEQPEGAAAQKPEDEVQPASASPPADAGSEGSADTATAQAQKKRAPASNSLRVDGLRLDRLIDLIGELVITETMVSRAAGAVEGSADEGAQEWNHHLGRLGKITREIHEIAGSLRMVPVTSTFSKMARLARDVSKKAGKLINFQVSGEDTELDKTLVDKIGDPLIHMIRNSVDHGLESSGEDRIAAGKPEVGRVDLRAFHKEGNIHIQVQDDGKGLDRDAILEKAIRKGLLKSGENISDRDVYRLICEPGFSTAAAVTEISGRGVGMDVVKKAIEEMGGKLEISSEAGVGTTMTLQLPLTLAVIDGMVVTVGPDRYIVPTLSVVRLVTPEDGQITTLLGREEMIKVHGELIPVVRLGDLFDDSVEGETEDVAIIAEAEGVRISLMVDEVLDQQQVVIKSLDDVSQTSGLSGCAIMPDGSVGLVLDVGGLVDRYGRATKVLAKASAG